MFLVIPKAVTFSCSSTVFQVSHFSYIHDENKCQKINYEMWYRGRILRLPQVKKDNGKNRVKLTCKGLSPTTLNTLMEGKLHSLHFRLPFMAGFVASSV